ncbi:MAG: SDR family NAD(P)-dependent oxidoreductase, partial [Actinomycetes bacterium]
SVPSGPRRSSGNTRRRVAKARLVGPTTGVLITGGASGIGKATAEALAEFGRPIGIIDRDGTGARRVAKAITATYGVKATAIACDVTDRSAHEEVVAKVAHDLGGLGGFVHAAGIDGASVIDDLDEASWDQVIEVNLTAGALFTKQILPHLRRSGAGSAICYISSIEGWFGNLVLPAYCSSKSGVLGLTRSVAALVAAEGIRANAICPGAIDTPLLQPAFAFEGILEGIIARTPMGRLGQPSEIASVVRFLLSDDASFITGQHITADGGMTSVSGV